MGRCGKPIYSLILYDAVAGGAGHVRRIVTEDGQVFERIMKKAFQIVNECKCAPSCYSCIRNYYNQKIHDQLDRKKAAAFLGRWLGHCEPAAVEPKAENSNMAEQRKVEVSGGESAADYNSWETLFEANGFEVDGTTLDRCGLNRAGWLVTPDLHINGKALSPNLICESQKIAIFDAEDMEENSELAQSGWNVWNMEDGMKRLDECAMEVV